jgi:4-hydroxythreonine-4-phosphate dehydrogenase
MMEPPTIGLFIGDPTGIGPEICAKVLSQSDVLTQYRIRAFGDRRVFQLGQHIAQTSVTCPIVPSLADVNKTEKLAFIDMQNYDPTDMNMGKVDPTAGQSVGATLKEIIHLTEHGHLDAIVYAPLNKEALFRGGYQFKGEIHFFAHLLKVTKGFGEMNMLDDLWTARVTSHISLAEVSQNITIPNIIQTLQLASTTLQQADIPTPRIGVAALNPHVGEGGLFGREEIDIITPAIQAAQHQGIQALGPFAADTIFLRAKPLKLDAIVSMYHDQGQIALKLMGFDRGVTVCAGLPMIIITPAHGTAFDMAGKGIADPSALHNALLLAGRMASQTRELGS